MFRPCCFSSCKCHNSSNVSCSCREAARIFFLKSPQCRLRSVLSKISFCWYRTKITIFPYEKIEITEMNANWRQIGLLAQRRKEKGFASQIIWSAEYSRIYYQTKIMSVYECLLHKDIKTDWKTILEYEEIFPNIYFIFRKSDSCGVRPRSRLDSFICFFFTFILV